MGQDPIVDITAQEFRFVPQTIQLMEGRRVRLRLRNQGNEVHTFHAPLLLARSTDVTSTARRAALGPEGAIVLQPGETVELMLQPAAGVYPFRCWIKGHAGMEGVLIVEAERS